MCTRRLSISGSEVLIWFYRLLVMGFGVADRSCILKDGVEMIQVLKHEWPARWPSFIPDLVLAAKHSETLCENCMVILKVKLKPYRY